MGDKLVTGVQTCALPIYLVDPHQGVGHHGAPHPGTRDVDPAPAPDVRSQLINFFHPVKNTGFVDFVEVCGDELHAVTYTISGPADQAVFLAANSIGAGSFKPLTALPSGFGPYLSALNP